MTGYKSVGNIRLQLLCLLIACNIEKHRLGIEHLLAFFYDAVDSVTLLLVFLKQLNFFFKIWLLFIDLSNFMFENGNLLHGLKGYMPENLLDITKVMLFFLFVFFCLEILNSDI